MGSSSHELCSPTAHEESKVHSPQALPACYVPPPGFGYPLDGLLPSVPGRTCFVPAALLGLTLRSLPPAKSVSTLPSALTHIPFGLTLVRVCTADRTARARFLGFALPAGPSPPGAGLWRQTVGCSLGLLPSRVCRLGPGAGFRPHSSHVLGPASLPHQDCTSEYRSAFAWTHLRTHREGAREAGQPS
jgi:hypothetical protein